MGAVALAATLQPKKEHQSAIISCGLSNEAGTRCEPRIAQAAATRSSGANDCKHQKTCGLIRGCILLSPHWYSLLSVFTMEPVHRALGRVADIT